MVFHTSAHEVYNKLFRELLEIEREVHIDKLDHFIQTARNLLEAVQADSTNTTREQRRLIGRLKSDQDFRVCNDIANRQKHFRPKQGDLAKGATVRCGFGVGRFGRGGFGVGEQTVVIELADGSTENALEFVRRIAEKLKPLFSA